MRERTDNLRIPGPTPLTDAVRAAQAGQVIDHRGAAMHDLYDRLQVLLQSALRTTYPCLPVFASGSGAMEAATLLLPPGSRVVVLSNGCFGERFATFARRNGLNVQVIQEGVGMPFDLEILMSFPRRDARAVFLVAHETSTGQRNHPEVLVPIIRARCPEAIIVVDVVSLAPAYIFDPDELGIDVLVASSTKAMMGPPGYGIVSLSARAQQLALARRDEGVSVLNLGMGLAAHAKRETPFTPGVTVLYGLETGLKSYTREGHSGFLARHERTARRVRTVCRALGLRVVARDEDASPTLTACWLPPDIRATAVLEELQFRHSVELGRGREPFGERIVRFAHMGSFTDAEIDAALAALTDVLSRSGTLALPRRYIAMRRPDQSR